MNVSILKIKRRISELETLRYIERCPIEAVQAERLTIGNQYAPSQFSLTEGQTWGEQDAIYHITFDLSIPAAWQEAESQIALHLNFSTGSKDGILNTVEGLIYINDQPFHAIDRYHREIILSPILLQSSMKICVRLWTGIHEKSHTVGELEIRRLSRAADQVYTLMDLAVATLETLPPNSPTYLKLLKALEQACARLDFRDVLSGQAGGTFYNSCQAAVAELEQHLENLKRAAGDPQLSIIAIGHAHIDVAWLWRLHHTRLKAANTFSTALYHMDTYPHFHFTQSQPQLYQYVKEDEPTIYERIKAKVASGQWEPEGAMWVEADTNLTGGESLVRQFLYGQRFFEREFGRRSRVLWLPDVFGYSAALPQLIKGAGADYFITSKISWNDTNRFPNDTFWWEGSDGSRVLTYFLTTPNNGGGHFYTYNGDVHPNALTKTWEVYRQKEFNSQLLLAYGWGDGGGGPTRQMIEATDRLARPINPQLPSVKTGGIRKFMEELDARVGTNPALPIWVGELYFEYHRGTYTSQGRTKRANRQMEIALHNAEWLAAFALLTGSADYNYPASELAHAWQTVLTHQFHDIIPGSSIGEVYEDATTAYAEVAEITDKIIEQAQTRLIQTATLPQNSLVAFNSLSWTRTGLATIEEEVANKLDLLGQMLPNGQTLIEVEAVPAFGYRAQISKRLEQPDQLKVSPNTLENSFYRLELNQNGQITRLLDKSVGEGREVLRIGDRANVFQFFEDKPLSFDAWDIDAFYEQKMWELGEPVSSEVIETGPLRAGVRLEWRYGTGGRTVIRQNIYLYPNSRRIDFVTEVDWQERQTLLKVAFPVDIHNGRATAEIQWGNIERPTHRNTSWDSARFETCAHKWVDLSEGNYGVALLNDCKYGYDIHGRVMRLTLLKGAISPDPNADLGKHEFTYSLLPHAGGWFEGNVHREAYELNYPLLVRPNFQSVENGELRTQSLVELESETNVILETIKKAEDTEALVVRLYECANSRSSFRLHFPFPISQVYEANLLEEEIGAVKFTLGSSEFSGQLLPYQIKTFIVQRYIG
jgi:alpha-mannosidase